jgi:carboxymethylenebutenolidase
MTGHTPKPRKPEIRKTAADFDPRILQLFDYYAHGEMTKRDFLTRAAPYTAAGVTGAMLLDALQPDYAFARQVPADDPMIETERVQYDSPDGTGEISALLARPAGATTPLPAVLVVHENRGLNPYIEDVVRRLAKTGYLALGPDGLSAVGGYPGNDDEGRAMHRRIDGQKMYNDFFNGYEYLRDRPDSLKVGAVGFCYGGGVCNALAVRFPDLAASVPFYGWQAPAGDVPAIQAPLMLHYAGLDDRINAGWPAYKAALDQHGKEYIAYFYEGVNHGFHNDTTPRYEADAAQLAWDRTLAHFARHL